MPISPILILSSVASTLPAAASLTTSFTGVNNDLRFLATAPGTGGNGLTVQFDVSGGYPAIAVNVAGNALRINAPIGTTALQVRTAFYQSAAAVAKMRCEIAPGNDGTGAIVTLAATALSGGTGSLPNAPITILS